jgi:prepilin-type processing-associated H-X9-DG protein
LICPAGQGRLRRARGLACSDYAVQPAMNVSIGFNMRLDRASRKIQSRWVLDPVLLTHRILQHPSVPIAFDVDGELADLGGVPPYYAAPPAGDPGKYGTGLYWFPGQRHDKGMNAAFVGGHVLLSKTPESSPGWDWRYQPPPGG